MEEIQVKKGEHHCSPFSILPIAVWESRLSSAGLWLCYMFMQLVAPSAVTMAVAIDAISCTMNLTVSFFVIMI